ncbi:DNA breaking-rejoining enzyme [Pseudomonas amygdali pv. mori]|uniref:DNA breaking-rejoining enzyme n=1 Tax=Pseudomonas amygdali pv. mori TaxID=34065 RepID=A0A0P9W9C8_PSEA0|nr:DNA breaking-rejoining enzyme [Pseudomonas amygdali pv. mori]
MTELSNLIISTGAGSVGSVLRSVLGYEFDSSDILWKLSKDSTLNMGLVMERTPKKYQYSVRKLFEHYATTQAGSSVLAVANSVYHLFSATNGELDAHQLINFKASLDGDYAHLHRVRPFLRRWLAFRLPGIDKDVVEMVDGWRLPGGAKGQAVKSMDPTQGPMSDFELMAFNEGAIFAYEEGDLSLYELSICLLTSSTGRRPIQITHLKCKDLIKVDGSDGAAKYLLLIPRAKQEGADFRDEFKTFQLTRDLYDVLFNHRAKVLKAVQAMGYQVNHQELGLVPLFPARRKLQSFGPKTNFSASRQRFLAALPGEKLHARTEVIDLAVKRAVEYGRIYSHRTDGYLHVFPKRFRYTLGTRAAREGMSKYVIAELLDHSDIQHVDVYTLNVPEHIKKIDTALGFQLARFAQAFSGNLVDSELDAIRGADPASRVRHRKGEVGTCGSFSYCGMNVPRPCYTCVSFQPWLDAPHEEFYAELLEERERLLLDTGDLAVASVLDRTIAAVAEVILKCANRKSEVEQ